MYFRWLFFNNKQLDNGEQSGWGSGIFMQYCQACKLCAVPLTVYNVNGELQKGLSGFLYTHGLSKCGEWPHQPGSIQESSPHKQIKKCGIMPCFDVNTKLGTGRTSMFNVLYILLFVYMPHLLPPPHPTQTREWGDYTE